MVPTVNILNMPAPSLACGLLKTSLCLFPSPTLRSDDVRSLASLRSMAQKPIVFGLPFESGSPSRNLSDEILCPQRVRTSAYVGRKEVLCFWCLFQDRVRQVAVIRTLPKLDMQSPRYCDFERQHQIDSAPAQCRTIDLSISGLSTEVTTGLHSQNSDLPRATAASGSAINSARSGRRRAYCLPT